MRHRSKTVLLALVATLAISAVASASASATPRWQIGGVELVGKEQINVKASTPLVFNGSYGVGGAAKIECNTVASKNASITAISKGSVETLELGQCVALGCIVKNGLDTHSLSLSTEDVAGKAPIFAKFEPAEGVFLHWTQTGCAAEGGYSISGNPRCEILKPTEQAIVKSCEFTEASGSTLTFAGKPMTIKGTLTIELSGVNKGQKLSVSP